MSQPSALPALASLSLSEVLPAIDGFLFLLADDGTIHDFRSGAAGALLMPPERFLGRRLDDVLPPDVAERVKVALATSGPDDAPRVVYSLSSPDGEHSYEAQLLPLTGHRRLAIVWRVTERVRVERELHEQTSRLRAILEATPECVKVVSRDGRLLEMNPAGLAILEEPDLAAVLHRSMVEYVAPEYRDAFARSSGRVLEGESAMLTFELVGRAGTRRWVESNAVPLRDAHGAVTAILAITRDISRRHRAEELLRESEARLAEAVRASALGIFEHDHRTDEIYWSPELRCMHGVSDDVSISPALILACIHPEDRARVAAAIQRAHDPRGDGRFDVRYRVPRRDGSIGWMSVRSQTTFTGGEHARDSDADAGTTTPSSRRPFRTVGAVTDITDEREREEALRIQNTALEASLNGTAIAALDGRVLYVNPAFLRMWGLAHDGEAIGRPITDFWNSSEDARAVMEAIASGNGWRGELPAVRRDGSTFVVSVAAGIVRGPHGAPVRLVASFMDVTEPRSAQAALARSEERFRALIENGLDLVLTIDRDGCIGFASPSVASILGYAPEDVQGRKFVDFLHPDDAAAVGPRLGEVYAGRRESVRTSFRARHRNGEWRMLEGIEHSLLHVPAVRATVANLRDVTQQHELEARLRQSQKLDSIGRLAGGVAHDFNNILTAILGYTQLMEEQIGRGHAASLDDLREVRQAAERARELTAQLLAFARRQVVTPRFVDINSVVRSSERMLARLVGEDIAITMQLAPGLWRVHVDPSQVEQVIVNLAVNARDAMKGGGRLTILTENVILTDEEVADDQEVGPGPFVLLAVSDSGTGIAPEALAHIFEPFFTTKAPGAGTGLGLATVYGIVRQARGTVEVESTPGRGTQFRIYLPRSTSGEVAAQEDPAHPPDTRGSERILVAEDDPAVRALTVRALREAGYEVDAVASGAEAIALVTLGNDPFHMLVTDVVMPGMSGKALADQLRVVQPRLRVLYVSGYTQDRLGEHGILAPGVSFLAKPFSPRQLTGKVRDVLDT